MESQSKTMETGAQPPLRLRLFCGLPLHDLTTSRPFEQ